MSDKLKPNFTPVPNIIFDEVMRTLTPGAVKVLFAICRYTYGWGKKSDRISLNQLSDMAGMDRANVSRAVRQLGNLLIVKPGDPRTNQASEYRINIEILDSDLVSPRQQNLVSQGQQASVRPSVKTHHIRRKTKERRERAAQAEPSPSLPAESQKKKKTSTIPTHPEERQTRALADPRVKPFLVWFAEEYEKRHGVPYAINWGKDGKLIRGLPPAFDLSRLKGLAVRFFESSDPWVREKGGFTVGVFISQINKLGSTGNGQSKPEVKDLGDGWLEVDGMRISRKDYERRWKTA